MAKALGFTANLVSDGTITIFHIPEEPSTEKFTTRTQIEIVREVIKELNDKTGGSFKATAKINITIIKARLNEGYTYEDMCRVIGHKSKEWDTDKMRQYLRPSTLFASSKFDGYLSEACKAPTNKMHELLKDNWND